MPAPTEAPSNVSNGQREHAAAVHTKEVLAAALSRDYEVHQGASLLYRIEIDSFGKTSNDGHPVGRSKSPGYGHLNFPHLMIVVIGAEPR